MIQAEHLSKTYVLKEKSHLFGKKKVRQISAVRDISLEIPKGKITGVLGINGAGKTTTIRMLASLITPTSGSLTMDGVDAVKNHLWVKERINMISGGERNLYWRLTAQENLRYFGSLYGIGKKELEERIGELLKTVGLEEAKDIPVERYSKRWKAAKKEIRELIHSLAKERGKGILLTTHYISEAEELCDYIYVLDQGQIIARGTKEELKEIFKVKPRMVVQEMSLEEVLMKIIKRSRGEGDGKDSACHEGGDHQTSAV